MDGGKHPTPDPSRLATNQIYVKLTLSVAKLTLWSKAVLLLWIFYVFVLSCVCNAFVRVFVVSNCEFVTFPLVSWVRYGT